MLPRTRVGNFGVKNFCCLTASTKIFEHEHENLQHKYFPIYGSYELQASLCVHQVLTKAFLKPRLKAAMCFSPCA